MRKEVDIEVRGARGDVGIHRLALGDFTFRSALVEGRSLAEAAEHAVAADAGFEPGRGLVSLAEAGLITRIERKTRRRR